MKKYILPFFIFFFIFMSGASALDSFSSFPTVLNPDSLGNYNLSQFTNYSYLFWVNGTGVSSYAQKWSYQYDTNGKVSSDKTYSVSTIAYINPTQVDSTDNVSGVGSPVVLLNGQACTVQTQTIRAMWEEFVNNNVQGTGIDWQPYDLDGLFYSVICENIMIKDNTSYLDFFFPNSNKMRHFNVSFLQFTETSGNSVEQAIQENNQALGTINNQLQDNWVKQEEIKQEQEKTNQELGELNDNLTNSDSPDNMDGLSNSAGWLPPGPIDSILNLPLSMLNNISDNLSKSCQPVNLPLPFVNKNLPLPCLSSIYSQIDGLGPWITTISVIASAFILFSYLLKLYKWVDDTLTFRENNEIDNWGGL